MPSPPGRPVCARATPVFVKTQTWRPNHEALYYLSVSRFCYTGPYSGMFPESPGNDQPTKECIDDDSEIIRNLVLGLFLGLPGPVKAEYRFTTYDVPGSTRTAINGNSTHEIAGEFDDADGNTHGFVLSKRILTQIDAPGAVFTTVNGINANGETSGIYIDASGTFHGYFRSKKGVFTTLDPPGAIRTQAEFLNAQGQVVGVYRDVNQTRHGFVWSKGHFTTFDVPEAVAPSGTVAIGINDRGEIVGDYVDMPATAMVSSGETVSIRRSTSPAQRSPSPKESTTVARSRVSTSMLTATSMASYCAPVTTCRSTCQPGLIPGSSPSTRTATSWAHMTMLPVSPTDTSQRLIDEPRSASSTRSGLRRP